MELKHTWVFQLLGGSWYLVTCFFHPILGGLTGYIDCSSNPTLQLYKLATTIRHQVKHLHDVGLLVSETWGWKLSKSWDRSGICQKTSRWTRCSTPDFLPFLLMVQKSGSPLRMPEMLVLYHYQDLLGASRVVQDFFYHQQYVLFYYQIS